MILDHALSALITASLIGIAAALIALALRRRNVATRFVWFGALLACVLMPLLQSLSALAPDYAGERTAPEPRLVRYIPSIELPPIYSTAAPGIGSAEIAERAFAILWGSLSAAMLGFLLFHAVRNDRRRRRWPRHAFEGDSLYVSTDTGPAVIGFSRPAIVVPAWFRELPHPQRTLVLAHERAHIAARDPLLLLIGCAALAAVPWNLPLWWIFVRLRHAIELDCDARVLSSGANPRRYGETLLAVAERSARGLRVALPTAVSSSLLHRRIVAMNTSARRVSRLTAWSLIATAGVITVAAAQIRIDSSILDQYVGAYRYSQTTVMHITRSGDHLRARFTGSEAEDIYPRSDTTFFYVHPSIDASIEFGEQRAVLRQNGAQTSMSRIDAATAHSIEGAVAERVAAQAPNLRSLQTLQRLLAGIDAGKLDTDLANAQLGAALRNDLPKLQVRLRELGPPMSFALQGVNASGADEYLVMHQNGTSTWSLVVDDRGTITGLTLP